ncbi:MAG TPA: ATP-binding protein [Bryobacteraceae bacterium]
MEASSKPAADPLAEALKENEALRNSLDAANRELQHFVYAASHDLQEPLRAVLTYTQLLERRFADDEEAREFASYAAGGAKRMNALLQNLVSYSRAGSSNRRGAIKLNAPLQWALLKLADTVRESGAKIRHGELPEAYADEAEIAQVFEHLVSNAIRFQKDGQPEIEIAAEEGSEECTIAVHDNGPGIGAAFHQDVFLPFKRLHDKGVAGSGLGLAICLKIVRAHAGRIWIESDGRHGTTVKFTLPQ